MQTTPTITVELIGSYTARHIESGTAMDRTKMRNWGTSKSSIPPLCRLLIEQGQDPAARVHVIRKALDKDGYNPVFNRDRSLATWAGVDLSESAPESLRLAKHRPYTGPVKRSIAAEHLEAMA